MNKDQAEQIATIEDYKRVTGAKRFKRNKDEMDRGLSVEAALKERIDAVTTETPVKKPKTFKGNGEIVIRIKPDKSLSKKDDADYIGIIPTTEIIVTQDRSFYAWLYERLDHGYDSIEELFKDLTDWGMGEVATRL